MTVILGIKLNQRVENSLNFQKIVTQYGCSIQTRVGLHCAGNETCSPYGIILLEIVDDIRADEIEKSLLEIDEIEIQKMIFN